MMKNFEYGDLVETTLGVGNFVEYSNGGQSYKIAFVDGEYAGLELSVSERSIKNLGREKKKPTRTESKYAPYIGNEDLFDAPVNLSRDPQTLSEFTERASDWFLLISASPDAVGQVLQELSNRGIENPSDYVRVSSSAAHGVKYDLFVPDPHIVDVDLKLGLYFNPIRLSSTGYYQIGRKEFVFLVLDKVRILEKEEKLPKL